MISPARRAPRALSATLATLGLLTVLPTARAQEDPAPPAEHATDAWVADYDAALARAKTEGKAVLVDFTGSDWCGPCIQLHERVFAQESFQAAVADAFVLCALDYPQGSEAKALVPNPERNDAVAKQWQIQSFPTILILASDETLLGRTAFREDGPAEYAEHVLEILRVGQKALADIAALQAELAAADADGAPAVLARAAALLETMTPMSTGVERLAALVRPAAERMDPASAPLRIAAIRALLTSGHADQSIRTAATELDPANEQGLRERAVYAEFMAVQSLAGVHTALATIEPMLEMEFQDAELGLFLFTNSARWCSDPNILADADRAARHARKALTFPIANPQQRAALEKWAAAGSPEESPGKSPRKPGEDADKGPRKQ